ncbi:MAG: T9SS type A sorting domain-containing protein [Flavobacteriales bacterium]|nr:T9SS type A sorting domain-containing protein [Flavobacteriales bacterium]
MKNVKTLLAIVGFAIGLAGAANAQTVTADVEVVMQTQSNWCWAANSECILRYYGTEASQCEINNFNWNKSTCCGSPGSCNQTNEMIPIKDILTHFGPVNSKLYTGPLSVSQITTILGDERPFIIGVMWNSSGGHVVVGCGYNTSTSKLTVMDPWNGTTTGNYSGGSSIVISGSSGTWKEGLEVTDAPGGSMPTADINVDNSSGWGSLTVQFTDNSTGNPDSWKWDFDDGTSSNQQNPTHTFAQGTYNVSLTVTNANGKDTKVTPITVLAGDPFPSVKGGPQDYASVGSGGYFSSNDMRGLIFDVLKPSVIKSVKVFADGAGDRTIEVLDAVEGNVLLSKTVNIPDGESRVSLGFSVDPGTGYHIKVTGSTVSLYRNNSGASFPYDISGLVSITQTDYGTTDPNYYYFFYDWEVTPQGCDQTTGMDQISGTRTMRIYPNPAQDMVHIALPSSERSEVSVVDMTGKVVYRNSAVSGPALDVNMEHLPDGMYAVRVLSGAHLLMDRVVLSR